MIRHSWSCDCGARATTEVSIIEAPVAPRCQVCDKSMSKVWKPVTVLIKDTCPDHKPLVAGRGRLHGISEQRELQMHREQHAEMRVRAKARARERRVGAKADEDIRPIASVPIQLFASRVQQFGQSYWTDDPVRAAKREGVDFGTE